MDHAPRECPLTFECNTLIVTATHDCTMVPVPESVCKTCPHRGQSVFRDLTPSQLDAFCRLKVVTPYKKGQRIFYEGEPSLGLFILCAGTVKISRSSTAGKRQIIAISSPCGLLAAKDLFVHTRRSVTAEAMDDCVVCFVKKDDFLHFLKEHQTVALRIIESLSRELEHAEETVHTFTAMDAKQRLANILIRLARRYGRMTPEGRLIEITLTREEIAEMAGTTHETAIRILSGFRKDRVIKDLEKRILVVNEGRLERMASAS